MVSSRPEPLDSTFRPYLALNRGVRERITQCLPLAWNERGFDAQGDYRARLGAMSSGASLVFGRE
jgi:hypothetical protein